MKPTVPKYAPWNDRNTKRVWTPPNEQHLSTLAADATGRVRKDYLGHGIVEFGDMYRGRAGIQVEPIGRGIGAWPVFREGRWCWHLNPDGHPSWTHKPETASQQGDVSRKWLGPLQSTVHGYHGTRLLVLTCPELGFRQREVGTFAGKTLNDATPEEIAAALAEATRMLKDEATLAVNRLRLGIRQLR